MTPISKNLCETAQEIGKIYNYYEVSFGVSGYENPYYDAAEEAKKEITKLKRAEARLLKSQEKSKEQLDYMLHATAEIVEVHGRMGLLEKGNGTEINKEEIIDLLEYSNRILEQLGSDKRNWGWAIERK
tara:strand:+ start:3092 stop:3478 length:387 start_codon:yes stop_codon:yes gene_type:complete